jgi:hypothetical protein
MLIQFHRSPQSGDHKHRAFSAQHFIIKVNADDGICAPVAGVGGKFKMTGLF